MVVVKGGIAFFLSFFLLSFLLGYVVQNGTTKPTIEMLIINGRGGVVVIMVAALKYFFDY